MGSLWRVFGESLESLWRVSGESLESFGIISRQLLHSRASRWGTTQKVPKTKKPPPMYNHFILVGKKTSFSDRFVCSASSTQADQYSRELEMGYVLLELKFRPLVFSV